MGPNVTVPKYFVSKKTRFYVCCNYSVPRSVNPTVVLMYAANTALDRSGDLRSGKTTVYSKKPSSIVITRYDEDNQMFLVTHCDCLQGLFISPHSLSVNGSRSIVPGETIRSLRFVLRLEVANIL